MPEITTLRVQRETKPNVEDVLPYFLDGEMRKTALGFVAHLRENKMTLRWAGIQNVWSANCKGKIICKVMLINDNWKNVPQYSGHSWVVEPYLLFMDKYKDIIINEGLQDIIWDNFVDCVSCPSFRKSHSYDRPCSPGVTAVILGKEIKHFCATRPLTWIWDPDEADINSIKRLLELEQMAREVNKTEKRGGQWPPLEDIV